jgi:hypothetical protein
MDTIEQISTLACSLFTMSMEQHRPQNDSQRLRSLAYSLAMAVDELNKPLPPLLRSASPTNDDVAV